MLIGVGLSLFGWSRLKNDLQLDQRNAVIEGKVINGYVTTGMRGGKWSHLVVEYQPPNHEPIRRKFDVDSTTYSSGLETRKTTVIYYPEDPQISRVTKFADLPYKILVWLGGAIALAGVIGLGCILRGVASRQ